MMCAAFSMSSRCLMAEGLKLCDQSSTTCACLALSGGTDVPSPKLLPRIQGM